MKPALDQTLQEQPKSAPDRTVDCRRCGQPITHRKFLIEAGGGSQHTFRNPAGYSFHVICYSEASGCRSVGAATEQESWFEGCAWSLAVCSGCQQHLGWYYSGRLTFLGLIATRLSDGGTAVG